MSDPAVRDEEGGTQENPGVYREVTDRIIQALREGVSGWQKEWEYRRPINGMTKQPYRGVNALLLWNAGGDRFTSQEWFTPKQAFKVGGIQRGSGVSLVRLLIDTEETEDEEGINTERRVLRGARRYKVYNREQLRPMGRSLRTPDLSLVSLGGRANAEMGRIESFVRATGADVRIGAEGAFYRVDSDSILMPARDRFVSSEAFYSTLLHELIHWTRHPSRLNREGGGSHLNSKRRAREELIAELGSAFLCADLGISRARLQHPEYVASWIPHLQNDEREIFRAARRAEKAVEYLHQLQPAADRVRFRQRIERVFQARTAKRHPRGALAWFARECGMNPGTVSAWCRVENGSEIGGANPSVTAVRVLDHLEEVAGYLGPRAFPGRHSRDSFRRRIERAYRFRTQSDHGIGAIKWFAEEAGLHPSTVGAWAREAAEPNRAALRLLELMEERRRLEKRAAANKRVEKRREKRKRSE
jgi:antirestriction protein ArdC